jgi:hypothetical protein
MSWQDVVALLVCVLSLAWLGRRLLLSYGPPAKRPDVTRASLLKKTRAHRKGGGDGHCSRC